MPRQYYIQHQTEITGTFSPTPMDGDLCQCIPEGGNWARIGGAWLLLAELPVVGVPLHGPLTNQIQTVMLLFLVADDPATLLGFGTWELIQTGKLFIGDNATEVWAWKRTA